MQLILDKSRNTVIQEKIRNTLLLAVSNLLFLLSAFPYISPVNLGFDTQPFALLFSGVLFVIISMWKMSIKLNSMMFVLLLLFCCACLYFIINPNLVAARSLAGYATLFFVTYASYTTSKYVKIKWFNFAVYVWFGVGVIQLFANKYFLSFLLPRMSTTEMRGVTSLAVEPSYYSVVCVFLLLINDLFKAVGKQGKKSYALITTLLLIQIVITKSGLGFVFLLVYLCSRFISFILKDGIAKHVGKLFLIGFTIIMIFVSFLTIDSLKYSRAGGVLGIAMIDPKLLLISDASIADRMTHAVLSFYSLLYSYGIGLGLGTWKQHFPDLRHHAGGFIEVMAQFSSLNENRIMSGWGTAVYELGFLGLGYMVVFWRVMRKGWKKKNEISLLYISSGITIFLMMSMSVPLAFPLFSYTLGMYMYYGYKSN